MSIEFRKPELADRELIDSLLRSGNSRSCEDCFANIYLWRNMYPVEFALVRGMLVMRGTGPHHSYRFPFGDSAKLSEVIPELMEDARQQGTAFRMVLVTPAQFALLEEAFPGMFQIAYERPIADYVYEREKLANLSGKKYHGKKNHVNKFLRSFPDWAYEPITDANVEDCFKTAMEWRSLNGCDAPEEVEMRTEVCVTMNALRLMKELHLTGGALRVGGRIAAFTIGEPLSEDTYVVHIEKALPEYEGAYTMINQQFVQRQMADYLYVNREDDAGDEGLRQAKESYHPVFLVEKGLVTLKD